MAPPRKDRLHSRPPPRPPHLPLLSFPSRPVPSPSLPTRHSTPRLAQPSGRASTVTQFPRLQQHQHATPPSCQGDQLTMTAEATQHTRRGANREEEEEGEQLDWQQETQIRSGAGLVGEQEAMGADLEERRIPIPGFLCNVCNTSGVACAHYVEQQENHNNNEEESEAEGRETSPPPSSWLFRVTWL